MKFAFLLITLLSLSSENVKQDTKQDILWSDICNNKYKGIQSKDFGFSDKLKFESGSIIIEREIAPESLDWAVYDYYVFVEKKLKYSQRSVIYPGSSFSLQYIFQDGNKFTNENSQPSYLYKPDLPVNSSIEQFC